MCPSALKRVSVTDFDFGLIYSLLELMINNLVNQDDNDDNKTLIYSTRDARE